MKQNVGSFASFRAASVAYLVALLFALTGGMVLCFFGTTVDSLRVAGGILLFIMAIDMLKAKDATDREDGS